MNMRIPALLGLAIFACRKSQRQRTRSFSGGNLSLSWPTIPGFGLYYATNLSPPLTWSAVTTPVFSENGMNSVTLTPTNAVLFFQLIDP